MSASFMPELIGYTGQGPFRFWCQKVLPLVYDDSLSYVEVLYKIVTYLNNTISDVANVETNVGNLHTAYGQLQSYVNEHIDDVEADVESFKEYVTNYLQNLNVQDEINTKLDEMATSGELGRLLLGEIYDPQNPDDSLISQLVSDWLNDAITGPAPGEAVAVDGTLSISGAAADAKVTGDEISDVKTALNKILIYEEIDIPSGTTYHAFNFVTGHIYKMTHNGIQVANVYTFTEASSSGEVVETIKTNWTDGQTVFFIPTQNAPAFRIYAYNANNAVISIEDISIGVPHLEEQASKAVYQDGYRQITEENTTFFTHSLNLFDKTKSVDGRLNATGTNVDAATGFKTSDYIKLYGADAVKLYTRATYTSGYCALYDAYKQVLQERTLISSGTPLDTNGADFMRVSYAAEQNNTFMVVDADHTPTEYIPYGYTFDYLSEDTIKPFVNEMLDAVVINPSDDVIQKLLDNKGKNIHFNAGNYDIIGIYENHFGTDYFTNYEGYSSGGDNLGRGLPVYRGTKMTFSQGAVFTANYTGNNQAVPVNFSAFYLESDVTVDGLRMNANGIRNCIHDDFDNSYNGTTIIKNCHLTGNVNIIAGGLGFHETVIIENCYIEKTTGNVSFDFSYHNNGNDGAQSILIVKDNYLHRGVSIRWYGPSTLLTDVFVNNNSMANDVDFHAENASATIENISLKKWNNEIRA